MGITDLIPGVSGGTVAVVLGIYDRFLEAISGFFSREWKRHAGFLVPLALGMGTGIVGLSRVIEYFLEQHFEPTQFFFIGLIVGVLPHLFKRSDAKRTFGTKHVLVLLIGAALMASLAFIRTNEAVEPITDLTAPILVGLFFSGWLASMAMLLPGISGSFVLLVLGVYSTAIHALSELNLTLIATIGSGVIIGFIVSSKAIRYLISLFPTMTYAVIIGMIFGSVAVVFPGIPDDAATIAASVVSCVAGLGLALFFGAKAKD